VITVTLETAQQLKAAGFPQETTFWWKKQIYNGAPRFVLTIDKPVGYLENTYWAAPIAEEILDEMPAKMANGYLTVIKTPEGYIVDYDGNAMRLLRFIRRAEEVLAEAAAQMWLRQLGARH
jgi:hypothetical protein